MNMKKIFKLNKKDLERMRLLNNYGTITTVASGIAEAKGLEKVKAGELVRIYPSNMVALALNLNVNKVGLVLCGSERFVGHGDVVACTGNLIYIKISHEILGTVIDPLGFNLSHNMFSQNKDAISMNVEQPAPSIISRQPIYEPLLTGITIIDSLVPIGRGQRELIIGDRQTGKTSIGIDTILNQSNVISVYVSIGQKCSGVAQMFRLFKKANNMKNIVIVCATASDAAPLQYLAPYTGCTVAEYFRNKFGDATLIVYDDLSKQAVAYRQLSLLLRRPPGREAFPGDVFYLHSRLLERAGKLSNLLGGGSLTALPIIETQAGDVSAYIATNVISITDGQLFLDVELFTEGVRPAVSVGLSVSRIGSAAQYPAIRNVANSIKIELAQYRDIVGYMKFGSELDPYMAKALHRGERLVEVLTQPQHQPNVVEIQIFLIAFCNSGVLDKVSVKDIKIIRSLTIYIIDFLFKSPFLFPLVHSLRYLKQTDLHRTVKTLLKFIFAKINRIK